LKNRHSCDYNRKIAVKFGGFRKKVVPLQRKIKQQEIDLIEECDGQISAFEYKWKPGKVARLPLPFSEAYPDATFQTITPDNYQEFV